MRPERSMGLRKREKKKGEFDDRRKGGGRR
jgi:hypothetical protein